MQIQEHALAALASLTSEDALCDTISEAGAPRWLLAIMQTAPDTSPMLLHASCALNRLASHKPLRRTLVSDKAVPVLADLVALEGKEVVTQAVEILCKLSLTPEHRSSVLASRVLEPLVKLLEPQGHPAERFAFLTIANLALGKVDDIKRWCIEELPKSLGLDITLDDNLVLLDTIAILVLCMSEA